MRERRPAEHKISMITFAATVADLQAFATAATALRAAPTRSRTDHRNIWFGLLPGAAGYALEITRAGLSARLPITEAWNVEPLAFLTIDNDQPHGLSLTINEFAHAVDEACDLARTHGTDTITIDITTDDTGTRADFRTDGHLAASIPTTTAPGPSVGPRERERAFSCSPGRLRRVVQSLYKSTAGPRIAKELPVLSTLLFESSVDGVMVTATNRYVLTQVPLVDATVVPSGVPARGAVRVRALKAVLRAAAAVDVAQVHVGGGVCGQVLEIGSVQVWSDSVDFPHTERLFGGDTVVEVNVDLAEFATAVGEAAGRCEGEEIVNLVVGPNSAGTWTVHVEPLTIPALAQPLASVTVVAGPEASQDSVPIAFAVLEPALAAIRVNAPKDTTLTLAWGQHTANGVRRPIQITTPGPSGVRALVAPREPRAE